MALCGDELPYALRFSFDEGGGTIATDSASGALGSLDGAGWRNGVRGRALAFDGYEFGQSVRIRGADGTECPSSVCHLSTGSISVWFRFETEIAPNRVHTLVYLGDGVGGPGPRGFVIEVGHGEPGDRRLFFTLYNGSPSPGLCFDSRADLEAGRWYHFVGVVGDGFNTGYLDGQEMTNRRYNYGDSSSRVFFSDFDGASVFRLGEGSSIGAPSFLDGSIDELAVFSRPLTAGEARDLWRSTAPHFLRGDVDADGSTTLSDAVLALSSLFVRGLQAPCLAAADVDDDDSIDVGDAVDLLRFEFAGGPPPAEPFPGCGLDASDFGCDESLCEVLD